MAANTNPSKEMSTRDRLSWRMTLSKKNNLPWAASKGYHKTLCWLLDELKVDPNKKVGNKNALIESLEHFKTNCALTLLNHGADPNVEDMDGNSALQIAIQNQFIDVVRDLIKFGAKIDKLDADGNSMMYNACVSGNPRTVALLIKAGCDVRTVGADGKTPLQYSVETGNGELVVLLMRNGCGKEDVLKKNSEGKNAIDIAFQHKRHKIGKVLEKLCNIPQEQSRFSDQAAAGESGSEINLVAEDQTTDVEEQAKFQRRQSSFQIFQKLLDAYKIGKDVTEITEEELKNLGVKEAHIPRLMEAVRLQTSRQKAVKAGRPASIDEGDDAALQRLKLEQFEKMKAQAEEVDE